PKTDPRRYLRATAIRGLDLLPANKRMGEIPERLSSAPDRHRRLRQVIDALEREQHYDYVVFDAPPSLGLVTHNIMVAANEIVVPVALTYFALDGCAEVVQTAEQIRVEHGHPTLEVSAVVPTLVRNTRLAREVLEKLEEHFAGRVTPALGFNVKIDEAQSHGQTIWEYAPWSRGAHMLEEIARAIRDR
ncbi:MAG: ParA family protein, partial [Deltaproteobacteria bacterium]